MGGCIYFPCHRIHDPGFGLHWGCILPFAFLYPLCKTKYKMSPSSVRSEGGEAAAGYCLNSVSYRVDEAVKYNVLNSD